MAGLLGNLLGGVTGGATSFFGFLSHPFENILFFIGGIMLLVIVYKIVDD